MAVRSEHTADVLLAYTTPAASVNADDHAHCHSVDSLWSNEIVRFPPRSARLLNRPPFFAVRCVASRPAAARSECGVEMTAGRRAVHPRWMFIFAAATTRQRIAR